MMIAIAALSFLLAAANGSLIIPVTQPSLASLPRMTVHVHPHGSSGEVAYEGVAIGDVLRKAGIPSGEAIRGLKLSLVVIVKGADGYQAVFALAELDPAFTKKVVLLADRVNSAGLPKSEGPYRLVVPDEARQARWVRQVVTLEVREVK